MPRGRNVEALRGVGKRETKQGKKETKKKKKQQGEGKR
jgi:hypothetical protein